MILRDSLLDTRIKRCILMDVMVSRLEYAGVREWHTKLVKPPGTAQMAAAKGILGVQQRRVNRVLRAGGGIYPPETKIWEN